MVISEKIQQYLQALPPSIQAEVLNYVEYLAGKAENARAKQEKRNWSDLSLSLAMRGMEDENSPIYTPSDLKVVFS